MTTVNSLGAVTPMNIQSMDLETALLAVQQERTKLLDSQLNAQIQEVQARNNKIAQLNSMLTGLNQASAMFKSNADATDKLQDTDGWKTEASKGYPIERQFNSTMIAANVNLNLTDAADGALTNDLNEDKSEVRIVGGLRGLNTKGDIEAAITTVKGLIDAEGNTQQMDMLRLQSMSNKRNEAFDVMTNFVKKMQDSRSSIIGNMR